MKWDFLLNMVDPQVTIGFNTKSWSNDSDDWGNFAKPPRFTRIIGAQQLLQDFGSHHGRGLRPYPRPNHPQTNQQFTGHFINLSSSYTGYPTIDPQWGIVHFWVDFNGLLNYCDMKTWLVDFAMTNAMTWGQFLIFNSSSTMLSPLRTEFFVGQLCCSKN